MTRSDFVYTTLLGGIYLSIGSTLISCVDDSLDEFHNNTKTTSNKSLFRKPIYLISKDTGVYSKVSAGFDIKDDWEVILEFVTYGYIIPTEMLSTVKNESVKIIRMDENYSCILFNTPIKTCLPRTYLNYELKYVLYEEFELKFKEKNILF